MNIFTKPTLTVALLGSLSSVQAQSVVEIHAPGDGEVSTVPLSLQTKISFSQTGIEIANEGAEPAIFPFATTAKITFKTDGNPVASIMAGNKLSLRRGIVETTLKIDGHDGTPACLAISSLSGHQMLILRQWNGESIDVANFAPGLYLIKINNQTFKFIKK